MTVSTTIVELEFTNVEIDVPFVVGIQTNGDPLTIYVAYTPDRFPAVQGLDYSVDIALDLMSFTITPTASLLAKINTDMNIVYVGRRLPLTTDFDNDDAFVRDKLVREFDEVWMALQQLNYAGAQSFIGTDLSDGLVTAEGDGTKTLGDWTADIVDLSEDVDNLEEAVAAAGIDAVPTGRQSYTVLQPTISYANVVARGDASGLQYAHAPSQPVWFDDRWHIYWNGNTIFGEIQPGQDIYFATCSGDNINSFTAPAAPFSNSVYANNPIITTGYLNSQAAAVAVPGTMWVCWVSRGGANASTYLSKKTTGAGKHTNYRLLFTADNTPSVSSTDINGVPLGGLSTNVTWDSVDYQFIPTGQGLVTTDGRIVFPGMWMTLDFANGPKKVGVVYSRDNGLSWRISGYSLTENMPVNAWEPVISETEGGFIMLVRNLGNDDNIFNYLECFSSDLEAWTEMQTSDLYIHQQRIGIAKAGDGIWLMAASDQPNVRENAALWLSRDGKTYTPGIGISDDNGSTEFVHYPEVSQPKSDYILYAWSRGDIADVGPPLGGPVPEDIRIAKVSYAIQRYGLYILPRRMAAVDIAAGHTAVYAGGILTLNGQASAGIEHCGDRFAIGIRYKLTEAVSTNRYYIAVVGDYAASVDVYVEYDGSNAAIFVNGERVRKRLDETLYETLELVVDTRARRVYVDGREYVFGGNPVVLLGDGYVTGTLATTKSIQIDVAECYWRTAELPVGQIANPRVFEPRNLIPNSNFDVAPQGLSTGSTTVIQYLPEFWMTNLSGATADAAIVAFALGQTHIPGEPTKYLNMTVTVANDNAGWHCIIPDARTVSGVEAVFSVWIRASFTGQFSFVFAHVINASAATVANQVTFVRTVGQEWSLVTIPFFMPSLGPAALDPDDHHFRISILNPANMAFDFSIATPTLNYGYTPIQWRRPDIAVEEARALRFYEVFGGAATDMLCNVYAASTTNVRGTITYQPKRIIPVISSVAALEVNGSNLGTYSSMNAARIGKTRADVNLTVSGAVLGGVGVFRTADANGRLIVNARY